MDIYTRITHDHDHHRDLIEQLRQLRPGPTRETVWKAFYDDVMAHADAEEQTFYAALIAEPDGQRCARHSIKEHEEIDDLFETLDALPINSPLWSTRFGELAHKLEHHMEEEEGEIFERARQVIGDLKATSLVQAFEKRKENERREPDVEAAIDAEAS